MQGVTARQWRTALTVGLGLSLLALAVTLATPYLDLPVGTATATGPSMGYDGMQVVVYVDAPPASVAVGDTVVYRDGSRLVHHRVVGQTAAGYVTRGDAAATTDQALGAPHVTERNLVGVVILRVPLRSMIRLSVVLVACWLAVGWGLLSRRGRPERA